MPGLTEEETWLLRRALHRVILATVVPTPQYLATAVRIFASQQAAAAVATGRSAQNDDVLRAGWELLSREIAEEPYNALDLAERLEALAPDQATALWQSVCDWFQSPPDEARDSGTRYAET